jgi:hypothetical protein
MAIFPVLPADIKSREIYLSNRTLPVNYMEDFSLMGFVVDSYKEACALLLAAGYRLSQHQYGTDLFIEGPANIVEISTLLLSNNINCTFSDIADTLYQA